MIRKFLASWPGKCLAMLFGVLLLALATGSFSIGRRVVERFSRTSVNMKAIGLVEKSGVEFPLTSSDEGVLGRLQAMSVVPVQDGGLALQWHLMPWPNSWFDRFPLTIDQNLKSARALQIEESAYWLKTERFEKHGAGGSTICPQANPLTAAPSKIWDATLLNSGRHLGEVWLSDSMVDGSHPDLQGTVTVMHSRVENPLKVDAHGTHIAGLMSALRNGEGVVGVVPGLQIKLFPLRLVPTKDGPRISGMDVLHDLDEMFVSLVAEESHRGRKKRVILLSWSFFESDGLTQEFIDSLEGRFRKLLEHDVAIIVPAGNLEGGRYQSGLRVLPASWANQFHDSVGSLLPVGSLDFCSRPSWFTNFAANDLSTVLLAPGERIYSTLTKRDFGYMTGTSASAAQVAAVLALTALQYPDVDMKTQVHTLLRTASLVGSHAERLVSFDAPAFVQGLMSEYGWIARY